MTATNLSYNDLKTRLIDMGDLKVWSVLVTIFGDLTPKSTDAIEGPVLSTLMLQMGIKPEALRVAIHRLKKDGWIETTKQGRISRYALSAFGRDETAKAIPLVYGETPDRSGDWFVITTHAPAGSDCPPDWISIGNTTYLSQALPVGTSHMMVSKLSAPLPDWAMDRLLPPNLKDGYEELSNLLTSSLPARKKFDALDSLTLRVLILHRWRRLVLRHHPGVLTLMPPDWTGSNCRHRVLSALQRYPREGISALNSDNVT
jgi:phenylacetic acid degradation operon negative regulatory protein